MAEDFSAWVGRREEAVDTLEPSRTNSLSTALGQPKALVAGDALPLLHHWLYFWDVRPPEGLGVDGHPARGGFLPPVPLPRRMWAGGRVKFLKPLLVGESVIRVSTIKGVEAKSGKSGDLVFVTVQHEIAGADGLAVVEEQDLVYREPAPAGAQTLAPSDAAAPSTPWRRDISPDTVLLFRYSALTMNGHRIHYDLPYARDEESYPGLVVHGPLQATLLADLGAREAAGTVTGFDYRGQSPAFAGATLNVCGEPTETGGSLWTEQGGRKSMVATITCG